MRIRSFLFLIIAAGALRQTPASIPIRGHIHPLAQARFDRGSVGDLFQVSRVTIMFKPTAQQQAELNSLLGELQDPSSSNYHHWLTPEEFGDRFGLSNDDFENVVTCFRPGVSPLTSAPSAATGLLSPGQPANCARRSTSVFMNMP